MNDVTIARKWYADELRYIAHIRSPRIVQAFATVPREHFLGPGPWRIVAPDPYQGYWTTEEDFCLSSRLTKLESAPD